MKGFPEDLAQQVELKFFKPIDSLAADVLQEFERAGSQPKWNSSKRSSWTRFLLSLLLRCPGDLAYIRQLWSIDFYEADDGLEKQYAEIWIEGRPASFREYLEGLPLKRKEAMLFQTYFRLVDSKLMGQMINDMHWLFMNIGGGSRYLFTSDRPIIRTDALGSPQGHLVLPVGPNFLFLATYSLDTLTRICEADPKRLIEECNRETVGAARTFAFSLDDSPSRFFKNRFGTLDRPRLAESVLAVRKAQLNGKS